MNISDNGIKLIKSFESCKLTAYKDIGGTWTIGYGHTLGVEEGQTIVQSEADSLLKADLAYFVNAVNKAKTNGIIRFTMSQNHFDALVSFTYNCGPKKLEELCKGKTAAKIAEDMLKYNKVKGEVVKGLTNRRKKEQALFLSVDEPKNPYKKAPKNRTYKLGSKGDAVKWIQWELNNDMNAGLVVDGDFGSKTEKAVKAYQKKKKLVVDGICGPKTIEQLAK